LYSFTKITPFLLGFGFISYSPSTTNFLSTFTVLNSASIKNVLIQDSFNPYIRTFFLDTLVVSNVTLLRNSYSNYTAVESGVLYAANAHSAIYTDIVAYDNFGPLFTATDVLWVQFTNIDIKNHTTSTSFSSSAQSLAGLTRKDSAAALQLNTSKPAGTGFQNFNVDVTFEIHQVLQ